MTAVAGVVITAFGRHQNRTLRDLGLEATRAALADAQISPAQLEGAFVANALAGVLFGDTTVGQTILAQGGISAIPVVNVENACTSGSTALWLARNAVAAGEMDCALVLGVEKMFVLGLGLLNSGRTEIDSRLGLVTPASFAMRAMRHMHEFGTTRDQMAAVVSKNRRHGALNPLASIREPMTIEDVLATPLVADPLTRAECCPVADGAAALIVVSDRMARRYRDVVRIDSIVLRSGVYENGGSLVRWKTDIETANLAYERAGVAPADLDLVECHDAFSIAEILHCEALGLCPFGEGGALAADGATALGGRVPINVSGGLLSRGHPVAATGVAQVIEIVQQLRGHAGPRQVEGARLGLAQCMGGDLAGDTKSCTVAVLSR